MEEYKQYTHEALRMMASEIDDKESLHSAHSLGYKTYGTGGFMGDSEKAWPVTETKFSASESRVACVAKRAQQLTLTATAGMAVKAVRVYVNDVRCHPGPIKLGNERGPSAAAAEPALRAVLTLSCAQGMPQTRSKSPATRCCLLKITPRWCERARRQLVTCDLL